MVATREIPPRTKYAIERLLKEVKADGYMTAEIGFTSNKYTIANALLVDFDGNRSFYWFDDGDWYEHGKVE